MTEQQACGCEYECSEYGARYRKSRCASHVRHTPVQNIFTEEKYRNMGVLAEAPTHVAELCRSVGELPCMPGGHLIEFGAGVSPYVTMVQAKGYTYTAVDSSEWACNHMRNKFDVPAHCCLIDDFAADRLYDVVLAAHVLEHVPDAPAALSKFSQVLKPGGLLYLIVPDDRDLHNQDHNWFFTVGSLYSILDAFGFVPVACAVDATIVPHEDFIYCVARKQA